MLCHAVPPQRRTDISKLSKVGISRNFGAFKLQAGNVSPCLPVAMP